MIVTVVQKVRSCMTCPNLRRSRMTNRMGHDNFLCLASGKKIGDTVSVGSQMNLKNNVSELCQFKDDEVNKGQPIRAKKVK